MAALLSMAGCATEVDRAEPPRNRPYPLESLPFADDGGLPEANGEASAIAEEPPQPEPPAITATEPIPLGTSEQPFAPLPLGSHARALRTRSGVILPVLNDRGGGGYLTVTPCEDTRFVEGEALGRAHVVLDPGHGGREVGAASKDQQVVEKELNLEVARLTKAILEEAGATVMLTRTADYSITTGARGILAKTVEPALFVSIHHNGGESSAGDTPGPIAFTKAGSEESLRFGSLFYSSLVDRVGPIGQMKMDEHRDYLEALEHHEAQMDAYYRSVADRDNALVANGQIPPEATTTIPSRPSADDRGRRPAREPQPPSSTTTVAATAEETIPVPDTVPLPPTFGREPVADFSWAGSGNAGVRSWERRDGKDYLSVLRHSGAVPAALVEFLYLSNPAEAELLADHAFVQLEAEALAEAIITYFAEPPAEGTGRVATQYDHQPIGGGGRPRNCREPELDEVGFYATID